MRITSEMLMPVPKIRSKSKNSKIYFYYDNFAEGLVQKGTCMYPKVECNFTINRGNFTTQFNEIPLKMMLWFKLTIEKEKRAQDH